MNLLHSKVKKTCQIETSWSDCLDFEDSRQFPPGNSCSTKRLMDSENNRIRCCASIFWYKIRSILIIYFEKFNVKKNVSYIFWLKHTIQREQWVETICIANWGATLWPMEGTAQSYAS